MSSDPSFPANFPLDAHRTEMVATLFGKVESLEEVVSLSTATFRFKLTTDQIEEPPKQHRILDVNKFTGKPSLLAENLILHNALAVCTTC